MSVRFFGVLTILLIVYVEIYARDEAMARQACSYEYVPVWQPLQERRRVAHAFSTRQIVAGKIYLNKKCNKRVDLTQLKIRWIPYNVDPYLVIDRLQAALYKKCPLVGMHYTSKNKDVVCTGRYHIADAQWSAKEQALIFRFAPFSLGIDTILYLVLNISYEHELLLRQGAFKVEQIYLPEEFHV